MIIKAFNIEFPKGIKIFLKIISFIWLIIIITLTMFILSNKLYVNNKFDSLLLRAKSLFVRNPITCVSNSEDITRYIKGMFKGIFDDNTEYPSIDIQISQKNILKLLSSKETNEYAYVNADLSVFNKESTNYLNGKLRLKGDRELHKESIDTFSYRVNLKDTDRLFGLEEFSIQRPLLRGYTWELLIAEIIKGEGLITLNSFPVHFSVNGDKRGIYIVEEAPSSRTVEKNSRKAGPIFGLNEEYGINIDSLLDVYDIKEWVNSPIYNIAKNILEEQFSNALNDKTFSEDFFDFDEWARYFALNDLFGSYHGTVPKSVKFYFNPVIGKFQPLLFDAHKGAGHFENFILSDFLVDKNTNESKWLVEFNSFYLAFLKNSKFYNLYRDYLVKYSTIEFIGKIKKVYENKFEPLDNLFYKNLLRDDAIFTRGNGLYIFKFSEIEKRRKLILKKLEIINQKISYFNFNNKSQTNISQELEVDSNSVDIVNLTNFNFKGTEITYNKPTLLYLHGDNSFSGLSDISPLTIRGPIMIVQEEGTIKFNNVKIIDPICVNVNNRSWSGSLNFISATAIINNLSIIGNDSEDSINFVNSDFKIDNISIRNARSDAMDFDFSNGTISTVKCFDIGNDSIDGSESSIRIDHLSVDNVSDKAVSAGENSNIIVDIVDIKNSSIGLVSKDGSYLEVNKLIVENVDLAVSSFTKKPEYNYPYMVIHSVDGDKKNLQALASIDSSIKIPDVFLINRVQSSDIEDLMYGHIYGVKTVK